MINDEVYMHLYKYFKVLQDKSLKSNLFIDTLVSYRWFYSLLLSVGMIITVDVHWDNQPLLFLTVRMFLISGVMHLLFTILITNWAYKKNKDSKYSESRLHQTVLEYIKDHNLDLLQEGSKLRIVNQPQVYEVLGFDVRNKAIVLHNKRLNTYIEESLDTVLNSKKYLLYS